MARLTILRRRLVRGKQHTKRSPRHSKEYIDYLNSPEWKALSDKVIFNAMYRCQVCNGRATQCHHRSYDRLKQPNEVLDLIAVCSECHPVLDRRRRKRARGN